MQQASIQKLTHQRVLQAWREQVTQTDNPRVKQRLLSREPELLPRFAAYYTKLQALPRRVRRDLQRRARPALRARVQGRQTSRMQSIAGVALLLALGAIPAQAANIDVNQTTCTLVNAITAANTDTATGGCPAGSGADTLTLLADVTLTAVNNTAVRGPSGLPVISSAITIAGNNHTIARSSAAGTPDFRIFAVNEFPPGNLTLQQTTISGGKLSGPADTGGGVLNFGGTLTLTNSTISGNSASGLFASGGGVYSGGILNVTNSTVSNNTATLGAGGIRSATIFAQPALIRNSTISGNTAGRLLGGGVYNSGGLLQIEHSTLTNNTAPAGYGSGVASIGSSSRTEVGASIIAGNANTDVDVVGGTTNSFVSENFNVIGDGNATGAFNQPGDVINVADPGLEPLALNPPGSTGTHALQTDSPAIDRMTNGCPPPATDQRGVSRPQPTGGTCDSGAYELEVTVVPEVDLAVTKTDTGSDPTFVGDNLTYVISVSNNGVDDATSVQLTDTLPGGVTFSSATPSQGGCGGAVGGAVSCNLGAIASGGNATVTLVVNPTQTGTVSNAVEVSATETDSDPANNTDTETTTVVPVVCDGLTPTRVGTPGNDVINGTNGADVIHGLSGNDTINGANGADRICGGKDNDTIDGGNQLDRLFGDAGNDALSGGQGNDALDGGADTDTCDGGNGRDTGANCETRVSIP
jgi:uncharacterized repeat protein (TIGR01451 family)